MSKHQYKRYITPLVTSVFLWLMSSVAYAVDSTTFYLSNKTQHSLTLQDVGWTGSYYPQLPNFFNPSQTASARLRRVGYAAQLSFVAVNNSTGQRCLFSIGFTGGSSVSMSSARLGSAPLASCSFTGRTFEMGIGDYVEPVDSDNDGIEDDIDNCPNIANPDQSDIDGDGIGDRCDEELVYVPMTFTNETSHPINLSNISFSGSYSTRFDTDVVASGDTVNGEMKYVGSVVQFGFDALNTGDNSSCFYTLTYDQQSLTAQAVRTSSNLANCRVNDTDLIREDEFARTQSINYTFSEIDPNVDTDGDGVSDITDNCPLIANTEQDDLDEDGIGDACDPDVDGDTVNNELDNCPLNANLDQADFDFDGTGDVCDDSDGDGLFDNIDNCPEAANTDQADFNNNQIGDACEDSDSDSILDSADNCPEDSNPGQEDLDLDNLGDVCDADLDGDLIDNDLDNCANVSNPDQGDIDEDGIGDVCDNDLDGDNLDNAIDNCPANYNPEQIDTDNDGFGDVCDSDIDGDEVANEQDNCPAIANHQQADLDSDNLGDACDSDMDGDTFANEIDNCPAVANPDQNDLDLDTIGDSCDSDIDGDTFANAEDCAAYDATINPNATEILNNSIDENCNGLNDDTIEGLLAPVAEIIETTPLEQFGRLKLNPKNPTKRAEKQQAIQSRLLTKLDKIAISTNRQKYTRAIKRIDRLMSKTDGCIVGTEPEKGDKINHCATQQQLYQALVEVKSVVQASQ